MALEKNIKISKIDYLLAFLFLMLCNFTSSDVIPGKTYILTCIGLYYFIKKGNFPQGKKLLICILSYFFVGCMQYIHFHDVNRRAILELPLLIISGYFIVNYLGGKFRFLYLKLLYYISIISLFFYFAMIVVGYIPSSFFDSENYKSIFIYNIRYNEILQRRNCGPFWEPGAFGGYLAFIGILYFNELGELWRKYKKEVLIILLTIITTFSTQTYITVFLIVAFYFLRYLSGIRLFFSACFIGMLVFFAYTSLDFLGEKIQTQIELTRNIDNASLESANRFTTFVTEMDIFMSCPYIGNTTNISILYRDYPYIQSIIERNGHYGSGSGISSNLAMYGLFPFLFWLIFSYKNFRRCNGMKSAIFCMVIALLLGNGEQYSDQILYLSLPFITSFKFNFKET